MQKPSSSDGDASLPTLSKSQKIAVLIPCYDEAAAIAAVVQDFRRALPTADVYVYDNNSRDATVEEAQKAGAITRHETRQGKGFVVRRMFADVEADIYIMVDGDGTYDAASAPRLVTTLIERGLDMVNAARAEPEVESAYRPGHKTGNMLLSRSVRMLFGEGFADMLSGYRVFSRRFVKTFPATSGGFEIETELTIHALELEIPFTEVATPFRERRAGSTSKLRTFHDGFRILWMILKLTKRERPVHLFGSAAALFLVIAVTLMVPVMQTYLQTGLVPRFPTLIASLGLITLSLVSLVSGLILDTVTCGRREVKRLAYLSQSRFRSARME